MATKAELSYKARSNLGKSLIELEQTSILELYELYFDVNSEPFRFHSGTNNLIKNIIWNNQEYIATAVQVEGFESNIVGRLPRPKITVSNTDYVVSSLIRNYADLKSSKFVRVKIFLKDLDAINFDSSENPFGTPDPLAYISREKYLISQKLLENKQLVQFELITPFDLQSLDTGIRSIHGRYCSWQYRGSGCNYQGNLISTEKDEDFSVFPTAIIRNSVGDFAKETYEKTIDGLKWELNKTYGLGDVVYVDNIDLSGPKDPPKTFFVCIEVHTSDIFTNPSFSKKWQKDGCSKTISACKKRFYDDQYYNFRSLVRVTNDSKSVNKILPFGGFPGADKFPYEESR